MLDAVFPPVMHDHRAHQHGEEQRAGHDLLLAREGEGTGKCREPLTQGIAVLPLDHSCGKINHGLHG